MISVPVLWTMVGWSLLAFGKNMHGYGAFALAFITMFIGPFLP